MRRAVTEQFPDEEQMKSMEWDGMGNWDYSKGVYLPDYTIEAKHRLEQEQRELEEKKEAQKGRDEFDHTTNALLDSMQERVQYLEGKIVDMEERAQEITEGKGKGKSSMKGQLWDDALRALVKAENAKEAENRSVDAQPYAFGIITIFSQKRKYEEALNKKNLDWLQDSTVLIKGVDYMKSENEVIRDLLWNKGEARDIQHHNHVSVFDEGRMGPTASA